MWYLIAVLVMASPEPVSEVKTDETVHFFPTVGYLDKQANTWVVPVRGWVFEPERDSISRDMALGALRRALELDERDEASAIFRHRAGLFLVDNERGKRIAIRIDGKSYALEESGANGHFVTTLRIPERALPTRPATQPSGDRWLSFEAVLPADDDRCFRGSVQLLGPTGWSVISDIDDTVKVSNVADRAALLANTFLRDFEAVPGMAGVYRNWAKAGASFHYVSASPWQLHGPLSAFFTQEGFPAGTFHLKTFRIKDSTFYNLFDGPYEYKLAIIEPILRALPHRRFILVGDSSEKDPEVYGELARRHPDQIRRIFIREVTREPANNERYRKAFRGLPPDRPFLFHDARELPATLGP